MEFCQWLLGHHDLLDSILFTDEYTFTRENTINMHNLHMWSLENPPAKFERKFLVRISIKIWCGLIESNIIGPFVLPNRLIYNLHLKFLRVELPNYWKMFHCKEKLICCATSLWPKGEGLPKPKLS